MQDPNNPVVKEPTETTPPQEVKPKEDTTPQEDKGGKTETPKEEVVELNLSEIKKVDGKFVYNDPDNPERTLYEADSAAELFQKIVKGVTEKDKTIAQMKSKQISVPKGGRKVEGEDEEEALEFPDPQEVLLETARKRGFDPAVFNWNKDKWREFEAANGVSETIDLKNLKAVVEQETNAKVAAKNLEVMNRANLNEEEEQIRGLCAEAELPVDDVDWEKVLGEAIADPKNYYKSGVRKPGAIVRRAAQEINRVLRERGKKSLTTEVTKEIADAEKKKKAAASDGGSVSPGTKIHKTPPKTIEAATERALKAFTT